MHVLTAAHSGMQSHLKGLMQTQAGSNNCQKTLFIPPHIGCLPTPKPPAEAQKPSGSAQRPQRGTDTVSHRFCFYTSWLDQRYSLLKFGAKSWARQYCKLTRVLGRLRLTKRVTLRPKAPNRPQKPINSINLGTPIGRMVFRNPLFD